MKRMNDNPSVLEQAGDPDSHGFGGPHSSSEDAAYESLSLIEEHEREQYVQRLVIGLS